MTKLCNDEITRSICVNKLGNEDAKNGGLILRVNGEIKSLCPEKLSNMMVMDS